MGSLRSARKLHSGPNGDTGRGRYNEKTAQKRRDFIVRSAINQLLMKAKQTGKIGTVFWSL
jgi:hypothetical protein